MSEQEPRDRRLSPHFYERWSVAVHGGFLRRTYDFLATFLIVASLSSTSCICWLNIFFLNNQNNCWYKKTQYRVNSWGLEDLFIWYKQCKSRRCWEVKLSPREVSNDTLTTTKGVVKPYK